MMATKNVVFYSLDHADNVLGSLNTVLALGHDEVAEIHLVSYEEGIEVRHEPIFVKFTNDAVFTVADDSEILQCVTSDGRKVTIFVGRPAERELQPARIVIAPQTDEVSET
jgi:hypothetical protein